MEMHITLTYKQSAAFMRRLGMYHTMELSLSHLIHWLQENKADFNLDGVKEKDCLLLAPMARSDMEYISYIVSVSPHLVA